MNKSEFERMISLVDEKYVDEMLEEKIYGKRKNIFLSLGAVAAALTLTVGGISYFVSTAGNGDIAVTDHTVVMIDDLIYTEVTNVTETVVPIDYEDFFRNKGGEYPISFYCNWDNEFGNDSQNTFDIDYVKSIIPFSAEGYSDSRNQAYAYCDGNNEPFGVSMYFESEFDETASPKFKSIDIYICTAGKLSHSFPLEEAEPVNCFGTDIYGFDDTDNYYAGAYDRKLKAYFAVDGMEYAIGTSNLSCEETVNIIRDIIQSGFSIKDFDLSAGSDFDYEVTDISLEEANMIEPFAGYIPQVNNVLLPYKGPTYDIVKINGEIYCQSLSFAYTDGTNSGNGRRILFEYYTGSTGRGAKPFDNTIDLPEISLEKLNDLTAGDEYKFTINCYGFMINVTAKCTVNELWAYIENIKGDTYKNMITL
ncbi:MAG: hypothetical protein K2H23_03585, partial [Oscillospiraceae bacterium]|nr:hypothetical protein [Oscillospiraceae bacterium]